MAVTGALSCLFNRVLMIHGAGMWNRLLKNIHIWTVVIALVVFIVVWNVMELSAGIFWGVATGTIIFFPTFNPKIKRHW